ncbi:MAG: ferredoxin subunit of nitrite reductase and ring-hydroxylating dioxygenase [Mycobacterium sp.]|nr:ferredoxin subunit of nitrite reductase and ring-hydroxylating dioxygenase [Mycobacterium sp.]
MSDRNVRRFVEGLLRGQPTERARPDDFEAQQMKTAIELRAARLGSDAPREEFVADLHRRLAQAEEAARGVDRPAARSGPAGTRRQVVIGTSIAAASAAAGLIVDRALLRDGEAPAPTPSAQGVMEPNTGVWAPVGSSVDVPDGGTLAFDLGSVNGFVHRVDGQLEAVSGICTHQGCRLWLDAPDNRLRCPCHSTSFSLAGETLAHQLPIAPAPLPRIQVRETNGVIEVYAPTRQA